MSQKYKSQCKNQILEWEASQQIVDLQIVLFFCSKLSCKTTFGFNLYNLIKKKAIFQTLRHYAVHMQILFNQNWKELQMWQNLDKKCDFNEQTFISILKKLS